MDDNKVIAPVVNVGFFISKLTDYIWLKIIGVKIVVGAIVGAVVVVGHLVQGLLLAPGRVE